MSPSPATILLVDDDEGHCELVRRHLRRGGINHPIVPVANGRTALDFVFCTGSFVERSRDADLLVLLDINMPGMDGIEVLRQIKSDPKTKRIPVLILTSAENPGEINRCHEYGCDAYITKSVDATAFIAAVQENLL
jgi:CheY-like chemotaxis protein